MPRGDGVWWKCINCNYESSIFPDKEKIKKRKNKKAQFKIQQTAFMLIFLTIFFIMVGIIFMSFWMANLKSNSNVLKENKAVILSQFLYQSAEFSCQESYCIDTDKILFLNSSKYSNLIPASYIKIIKIGDNSSVPCTLSNYPNCNLFQYDFKSHEDTCQASFVALCRIESNAQGSYKKCELGKFCVGFNVK